MSKIGQSGHSVAEAVSELVDNALDARRGDRVKVSVNYDSGEGWIEVEDDGAGMSRQELANALVLGLSKKRGESIGRFGLGLKTAATALGPRFQVTTVRDGGKMELVADYDEQDFLAANRWEMPISRQVKQREIGTSVKVYSDRVYPKLHQSLERNLGWTFRHFLKDGILELSVNGVAVEPSGYDVDQASVMPFHGTVAGRTVSGWVGLLHKSSQRGWYGFSLVRHRRIVRRFEKLGFQAHPSTARVAGEIHLDDFDTNNLKTDFIRETAAWRELEEWISQTIEPVLSASRRLAHSGMADIQVKLQIERERERLLGADGEAEIASLVGGRSTGASLAGLPVSVAVGPLHLEHSWVWGDADGDYADVFKTPRPGESDLISVVSNLRHPVVAAVADRGLWACHNVAEAAARFLGPADSFSTLKGVVLAKLLNEGRLRRALAATAADDSETPEQRSVSL